MNTFCMIRPVSSGILESSKDNKYLQNLNTERTEFYTEFNVYSYLGGHGEISLHSINRVKNGSSYSPGFAR
jgi:hypothetical protein